jgi:hypothetical protein
MNQSIVTAINNRYVLSIFYDGGTRIIEPHCYGISTEGNELLRAFQVNGYSNSGNPIGWKLFRVDNIMSMESTGDTFVSPRPGYNPLGDKAMAQIYCKL